MPAPWGISTGIRPAKTAREMLDERFREEEIVKFMQDEFWMSPQKARLSYEVAKKEKNLLFLIYHYHNSQYLLNRFLN